MPTIVGLLQQTALFLWKDWPRNMKITVLDEGDNSFSLRGECPHCHHNSTFMLVMSVHVAKVGEFENLWVGGMECQGCLGYILGLAQENEAIERVSYLAHYPVGEPRDDVADEIPDHIKPDFKEAHRCLWVNAYNATAEMCRRAVEASCIDLGAPRKDVLEDMIDWLEEHRIITPGLKDVAHKVRLGGNRGAHPGPIEAIGEKHANAILNFTRHFFQYVYVTPKQLDQYDFSKPKEPKA
jgi:hypothetical protein